MRHLSAAALAATLFLAAGCGIPEDQGFTRGIPFRQQIRSNYCVPASILMWRLYDGLPEISQHVIFEEMGGTPCTVDQVPAGVSQFTRTFDTFADIEFAPTEGDVKRIVARQITAVGESRFPAIAVVGLAKDHVGVLDGGKYRFDESSNLNVWETVYFHDPGESFGDREFGASQWLDFFCREGQFHCAQVVSSSSILGWDTNLNLYGSSITFYGEPAILNQDP